jgi:type I restriction enzyme, S subunit
VSQSVGKEVASSLGARTRASPAWPRVRLGELLTAAEGRATVLDGSSEYALLGARWYAKGLYVKDRKSGSAIKAKTLFRVEEGDFVYNRLFAWKGSFAVATSDQAGAYVSNEFPCFSVRRARLDPRFLWLYFSQERVWNEALGLSFGATPTSRNRLKEAHLLAMSIPLPPLPEQHRIVSQLDHLSATISEGVGLRHRASKEGGAIVPAYLNRIIGTPSSGPLRQWSSLNELVHDVADGPHVTPTYVDSGVPFITVLNITTGRIQFGNHSHITEEDHRLYQRRARAERGDVLLSKDGTIGLPCFVDTDREFSFFVSVALIKPRRDRLLGEFLTWVLRAPALQDHMWAHSRGDMIRHLVLREIRALPIPVLDVDEQRQIVDHLDRFNATISDLRRLQSQSAAELQALTAALLDRAFKGEL